MVAGFFKVLFVHLFSIFVSCTYSDEPFQDPYVIGKFSLQNEKIAQWEQLPIVSPATKLEFWNGGVNAVLLTEDSLWIGMCDADFQLEWIRVDKELDITVTKKMNIYVWDSGLFFLAGGNYAFQIECTGWKCEKTFNSSSFDFGEVTSISSIPNNGYWIGSTIGLFLYRDHKSIKVEGFDHSVSAVSTQFEVNKKKGSETKTMFASESLVAVGTIEKLYIFTGEELDWRKWRHYWVGGNIDSAITALSFDPTGNLWIGNADCVNLLDTDFAFHRFGGLEGLPSGNITTIEPSRNRIFIGTKRGLCVLDREDDSWSYFYMDRWIHGETVLSISFVKKDTVDGNEGVFVMSNSGGSILAWKTWTLQDKGEFYEAQIRPRHVRYGLVSDVGLHKYGDISTYYKRDNDNDGSWTAVYLISQIYRYAHEKSKEARENCWEQFAALELLNDVTGIPGFAARSILPINASHGGGEWFNSTVFPEFQFKADTSSDEIICHVLTYTLFYDLVAETEAEKTRVLRLLHNMVSYIVDNNFMYIDVTGKPTTWGRWDPAHLNDDFEHLEERGLNSMQILGFLLSVYSITQESKFLDAFNYLVDENGYDVNIINQKITSTEGVNHVDDDLGFLSAFLLDYTLKKFPHHQFSQVRKNLQFAVRRHWAFISSARSIEFDVLNAVINEEVSTIPGAIWSMQTFPQDLINWPNDNRRRMDVLYNPEEKVRRVWSSSERMNVLPYREGGLFRWDCDPFQLKDGGKGGDGLREFDGGAWLMGYWIAMYHEFIIK